MKALLKDFLGYGLIFAPAYTVASVITGGLRFGEGASPIPLQLLKFFAAGFVSAFVLWFIFAFIRSKKKK